MIQIKRVYEPFAPSDGARILVDRLWPRGVARETARIGAWRKDLAPSDALRKWFGHDPARFREFRDRYRAELLRGRNELLKLAKLGERGTVTLVFAAKDPAHANAIALKELLDELRT